MSSAALTCPSCGVSPIPAEDVELSLMIAKCAACDTVFSFAEAVGRDDSRLSGPTSRSARGPAPVDSGRPNATPEGPMFEVLERATAMPEPARSGGSRPLPRRDHAVTEVETVDGLALEMRWFSAQHVALALFALIWNGFLVVWYAIAFSSLAAGESAAAMGLCFPVIHVAVGIGVGYGAIAGFVNHTLVDVRRGRITVTHGPLWWPGAVDLAADRVDQLFVELRIIRGKNSSRTVYDLKARMRDGATQDLCKGLSDLSSARYLEHRMEGWLGIVDQPVAGEHLGS